MVSIFMIAEKAISNQLALVFRLFLRQQESSPAGVRTLRAGLLAAPSHVHIEHQPHRLAASLLCSQSRVAMSCREPILQQQYRIVLQKEVRFVRREHRCTGRNRCRKDSHHDSNSVHSRLRRSSECCAGCRCSRSKRCARPVPARLQYGCQDSWPVLEHQQQSPSCTRPCPVVLNSSGATVRKSS